ncbi:MAG: phenylalanine--tRNA ligase subunit alpha [Deltaproteobacteria bacterium]|nr:phenylalanine--tRNA ligase subunit alpha [Deltaproteobacteria bacterium]
MELPLIQCDLLRRLGADGGSVVVADLVRTLGLDQSLVVAAAAELATRGLVTVEERVREEIRLGPEGEAQAGTPLPERAIVAALEAAGGRCPFPEVSARAALPPAVAGGALRWLKERGWASKQGIDLVLLGPVPADPQPDEVLLAALAKGRVAFRDDLEAEGLPVAAGLALLLPRKGFVVVKERAVRRIVLTEAGRAALLAGVQGRRRVTALTPEMLSDGSWRDVDFAPYDVTLAARRLYPGKEHPFQRLLDRVRRVFLEMGFEEVSSPWVESSFWDFDALFQPQDHPARDMQDTFYVARPDLCRLPDPALVDRVRRTHEDGGDTGSTGWQYRWDPALAPRPVLRTHCTAATIRALARHAGEKGVAPGRYFAVGPVFRRETVDYKHLPVFHQVDGIIVDPHASLATLVGTLTAFYQKMGFPKVQVVPSFFPYTEPSAEVRLYLESRRDWVEMGGSGIFRPEVTRAQGIRDRVLAWGLGLDRLAMMTYETGSLQDLFYAAMPWLREEPLCRS